MNCISLMLIITDDSALNTAVSYLVYGLLKSHASQCPPRIMGSIKVSEDVSTHPSLRANPNPPPPQTLDLIQGRVDVPLATWIDPMLCDLNLTWLSRNGRGFNDNSWKRKREMGARKKGGGGLGVYGWIISGTTHFQSLSLVSGSQESIGLKTSC